MKEGDFIILTVAIQKGGTGKTTTAAALVEAAAYKGMKSLAIDLDPQGNLSFTLQADTRADSGTSYDLLTGHRAAGIVQKIDANLYAIPASPNLAAVGTGRGSARRLADALAPIRADYDFIVIDTPPTAGELENNALQAADGLVIPLQADAYNLQSLYQIAQTAALIRKSNPRLVVRGLILTQYDGRANLTRQIRQTIIQKAAALDIPYLGSVRAGIAVKEAAALQQSLFDYAPKSNPAIDYMKIYETLTAQENTQR